LSLPILALFLVTGCAWVWGRNAPSPQLSGGLASCPASPNCVSSLAPDAEHAVAPLTFTGDAHATLRQLRALVESMPRAHVVAATDLSIHAQFTSRLLRFVDDVDMVVDPASRTIHVRSASRVGYSDWGVNRARIEDIRKTWNATQPTSNP